ncbi:MAG: glycosyltransferase involved in cell wall biosynthesis [Gammaproteobacteria bacterium]
MKVLLVNDFGSRVGGAESYFFTIRDGLCKAGDEVRTVSSDRIIDGAPMLTDYQLPHCGNFRNLDSYFNPVSYWAMRRVIAEFTPDVVHFNNVFYALSPSVLLATMSVPSVMTLHDYYPICATDKRVNDGAICHQEFSGCREGCMVRPDHRAQRVRRWIIRRALGRVAKLIAPSTYLKEAFALNGIYNARTIQHYCETGGASDRPVNETPSATEPLRFLYLGRLVEQKGIDILVRAFAAFVRNGNSTARLAIAGRGLLESEVNRLIFELNLSENVEMLGWISGDQKIDAIEAATAIVVPSRWAEVAGLSAYESARLGRPTIASRVGGLPEFVNHDVSGLLFENESVSELAQCMQRFVDDPSLTARLGAAARDKALGQSVATYVVQLRSVYAGVLEGATSAG